MVHVLLPSKDVGLMCYRSTHGTHFQRDNGFTTLNKPKSRQMYTNDIITTQIIFNAAVSIKIKNKHKEVIFLWIFNKYTMSPSCRISDITVSW